MSTVFTFCQYWLVWRVCACVHAGFWCFEGFLCGAEWSTFRSGRASAVWSGLSSGAASVRWKRRSVPDPPFNRAYVFFCGVNVVFFRVRLYATCFGCSDREDNKPRSLSRLEWPTPARRQPRERVRDKVPTVGSDRVVSPGILMMQLLWWRMADWLKKQAEREAEKEQRRVERLKRKLREPEHRFSDVEFQQQCHELSERLEDSVIKGGCRWRTPDWVAAPDPTLIGCFRSAGVL